MATKHKLSVEYFFKDAVYEPNDKIRYNKLIEGCKILSDILPFDNKNYVIP